MGGGAGWKGQSPERGTAARAAGPTSHGPFWSALQLIAAATVLLQVAQTLVSIFTSAQQFRLAGALVAGGAALLRGLVAFGAVERRRWSLWGGGVIAGVTLVSVPFLLQLRVETAPGKAVEMTPVAASLAWGQVAANAAFLIAAILIAVRSRRERSG
jgi:hypothetical protein